MNRGGRGYGWGGSLSEGRGGGGLPSGEDHISSQYLKGYFKSRRKKKDFGT